METLKQQAEWVKKGWFPRDCGGNRICFVLLLTLLSGAVWTGCGDETPLNIGFVAPLSGPLSDYGLSSRRGGVLAVEEINADGGIQGRKLALIVRDDQNDPLTALKVDEELVREKVVAIVGHFTSTASVAATPFANAQKMLLISPAASTGKLTGQADFFLRVHNSHTSFASALAEYAYHSLGLKKAAAVYDLANQEYSENYYVAYKVAFEALGGTIGCALPFDSRNSPDIAATVKTVIASGSDHLFIIAGVSDSASLCQEMRKRGSDMKILSSGWARRRDFIENGGKSVEGVVLVGLPGADAGGARLAAFKKRFSERFGTQADFAAIFGYDAVRVLTQGLKQAGAFTPVEIRSAILRQGTFPGLHGDFSIDRYGDAHREVVFFTVRNGAFVYETPPEAD
ncbi:hypothetical protein DENIS_0521 [Desulfonema ishimotonii]|uniref:Leucine-binding protein domain-containing protein n=1 Tax=Desulfonema ishimotonii TaxID=45657 RepID=A0A401FRI6_9BACT|nr:ABC transporter substrate-binding protein [Desulfonema ishimotonii]GBC59582.1 hypothetical protein DENIS_0521 [Desulfonema ishimotonii]